MACVREPSLVLNLVRPPVPFLALLVAALVALACTSDEVGEPAAAASGEAEVELAVPMAHLQRHSAKLGYAIEGENGRLAGFYLTETEEALGELREVESYEGYPVARQVEVIMEPTLPPLRRALEGEDWPAARGAYETLIQACNRCHAASEHEYLVMEPARGPAPYNQRFAAGGAAAAEEAAE